MKISFYTVNTNHVKNKMASVEHTTYKNNYDVLHITEAGLGKKLPDTLNGYKAVKHERNAHNRGSIMYIKDYYHDRMVRITDPEDNQIGMEIIHLLLDTFPPSNILGVYQETDK